MMLQICVTILLVSGIEPPFKVKLSHCEGLVSMSLQMYQLCTCTTIMAKYFIKHGGNNY